MVPQLLRHSALMGLFFAAAWHSSSISATKQGFGDYTLKWVTCDSLDVGKNLADGCLQYENTDGSVKATVLANYNGEDELGLHKYTGSVLHQDGSTDQPSMNIKSIGPGFPIHSFEVCFFYTRYH